MYMMELSRRINLLVAKVIVGVALTAAVVTAGVYGYKSWNPPPIAEVAVAMPASAPVQPQKPVAVAKPAKAKSAGPSQAECNRRTRNCISRCRGNYSDWERVNGCSDACRERGCRNSF